MFGKRKIKPKNPLKKVKSIGNSLFNHDNKKISKKVYENMKKFLENYTSYIGALRFINESKNFKIRVPSDIVKLQKQFKKNAI